MIKILLDLLAAHSGEIGTAIVTGLLALLKRWLDKKGIRKGLQDRGVTEEIIKEIV